MGKEAAFLPFRLVFRMCSSLARLFCSCCLHAQNPDLFPQILVPAAASGSQPSPGHLFPLGALTGSLDVSASLLCAVGTVTVPDSGVGRAP